MTQTYQHDFEKFLSHTNEKAILLEIIAEKINSWQAHSLLDIGAGNGLLAIPLSRKIEHYTALEPKASFATTLREAGLAVIEGEFPQTIDTTFDIVLASHVVSYQQSYFEPFICEAFKLVAPDGHLAIVTFRGKDDDWNQLMTRISPADTTYNQVGFSAITNLLPSLGETTIDTITTTVETTTLNDMIEALAFVFSDGKPNRKEIFLSKRNMIETILEQEYKTKTGYSFPFQHFMITTKKGGVL